MRREGDCHTSYLAVSLADRVIGGTHGHQGKANISQAPFSRANATIRCVSRTLLLELPFQVDETTLRAKKPGHTGARSKPHTSRSSCCRCSNSIRTSQSRRRPIIPRSARAVALSAGHRLCTARMPCGDTRRPTASVWARGALFLGVPLRRDTAKVTAKMGSAHRNRSRSSRLRRRNTTSAYLSYVLARTSRRCSPTQ
jgi:hypothetical protein